MRRFASLILVVVCCCPGSAASPLKAQQTPNVILIMTDDQGIGDLGVMGNRVIDTPHLDRLAGQSAWLTNFYVHPVCAPTRACLLTGRYNYRTRAIDTYIGRAMLEPEELTIAEVLRDAGYATGIFGKWHLGDCYPMRAMDQGFETAIVHRGGGIGQPSDPPQARGQYTNPVLFRNGVAEAFQGYCTDIYYDQALQFIESARQANQPFFAYLPDNTPHGPFADVPQTLYEQYLAKNINRGSFGEQAFGQPFADPDADFLSRVYAMISNVDRNVGRLLERLDQWQLTDNTIVIFMCDNGPNSQRFLGGYRGHKGSVYEGGIRSPFFIRWPGKIRAGYRAEAIAAHIDVLPTLLGLAGVTASANSKLDGLDLSGLLLENQRELPERHVLIQSHRGDQPTRYHHMAVRGPRWKLVHPSGFDREAFSGTPQFELYDMLADPFESSDVAQAHPQVVSELQAVYDQWFDDVSATRVDNYAPPQIIIHPEKENPLVLTRQDWRRTSEKGWGNQGYWIVRLDQPLTLSVTWRMAERQPVESLTLLIDGAAQQQAKVGQPETVGQFQEIYLRPGEYRISASGLSDGQTVGVHQLEIRSAFEK